MRVRDCVPVLALLAGVALAQAPPARAAAPAAAAMSAAERSALGNIATLFNNPATQPAIFDQAISGFRQQYPHSRQMLTVLITAVRYHRRRGEYLPELHYGMEVLQLDPHNLYTLSSLGMAIPENVQSTDLDLDQRLAQAEGYDHQVLAVAQSFTITPQGMTYEGNHFTAAQAHLLRDNLAGPAYASLGRIALIRKQYAAASAAYKQALEFETTSTAKAQTWYDVAVAEAGAGHMPQAQAGLKTALGFAPQGSLLSAMILRELQKVNAAAAAAGPVK